MPTITITKLYDLVSVKLGKETAENLTTFIEEKIKGEVDTKTSILATKEDVSNCKAELARDIRNTDTKIETAKAELKADGANSKAELIKWMFVFWIGQLVAFVMLFLKK
jgi:hypothetical protein